MGSKKTKKRKLNKKTAKKVIKKSGKILKIISLSLLAAFVTFVIVACLYVFNVYQSYANDFQNAQVRSNSTKNIFYDKDGNKIYESFGAAEPDYVELSEVPEVIKKATLASEDLDFYDHGAVDYTGLLRAAYLNFTNSEKSGLLKFSDLFSEEHYSQGGSSITQQLVKNLYLTNERSFDRKIREVIYAYELEKKLTKDEIFESYLNNVYYGEQSLGISNAAETYYGKDISSLNIAEVTMLAGLPAAPSRLSPMSGDFDAAKERQKYVLSQMYYADFITIEEAQEASQETLYFTPHSEYTLMEYPYFVNYVKNEVMKTIGEDSYSQGGITVHTTLDPSIQKVAEKESEKQIESLKYKDATNAAVVVLENDTGEIKGMVGGVNYTESKVNVSTAKRQPGSSFKPIVYMAGLLEGYTANTILHDKYTNFGGIPPYVPRNYNGGYMGNVTMRTALANSLNIPAVEMAQLVGVDGVIETAEDLGISTIDKDRQYGLSIGLGTAEVGLLELSRAYSTFANLGKTPSVSGINKITDSQGLEIYIQPEVKKEVISPQASYVMTSMLSDNNARRRTFGARSDLYLGDDRPVAAKTGTTDDYSDAWTVGYTPQYTVGVWVGNNDHSKMRYVSGLVGAAPIWNAIMSEIHEGLEGKEFEKPSGLIEDWVSPYTGKPASYEGAPNILEYFVSGTEPKNN